MHVRRKSKIIMKARAVAWNGPNQEYKDDLDFKALNDYKYGQIKEIEELTPAEADEMENGFKEMYPDFEYNHMEIVTE